MRSSIRQRLRKVGADVLRRRPRVPPIPPPDIRRLSGDRDEALYDNPSGGPLFHFTPDDLHRVVFDFGCGDGRLARQLVQRRRPPVRYVGVDVNERLVTWCRATFGGKPRGFEFHHHREGDPLPVGDHEFDLVLAIDVFTQIREPAIAFYLGECARILRPAGLLVASWFLTDADQFPVLRRMGLHTVYADDDGGRATVFVDRQWLSEQARAAGLKIVDAHWDPADAGMQWTVVMAPRGVDRKELSLDVVHQMLELQTVDVKETDRARRLASRYGHGAADLEPYEFHVTSQNGEDGVIAEILRRIGITSSWFVEFGVEDGGECNCRFLADSLGWNGLFMEADDDMFRALAAKYQANDRVTTRQAMVEPSNIDALLREAGVPAEIDLLSIDIDGNDYWVWEALEATSARVAIVEVNTSLPAGESLVQPYSTGHGWDGTNYYGASLGALSALAARKGYRLVYVETTGTNAFFVRSDLAAGFDEFSDARPQNIFHSGRAHPSDPLGRAYVRPDPI